MKIVRLLLLLVLLLFPHPGPLHLCPWYVDDQLGRVLSYLDESGLSENTVIVYSSDQGFFLGDHGWFDKRWMYEESFRTPLLVRWPGVIAPATSDAHLVQNLDFAQTGPLQSLMQAKEHMDGGFVMVR